MKLTRNEYKTLKLFKYGYWTDVEGSSPENFIIRRLINYGLIESEVNKIGIVKYRITSIGLKMIRRGMGDEE